MLARALVPPMPSITYVARRSGPFSALVQASEIGGLRLEPHPPARVLDRLYDTDDGELLRQGRTLRVREQDGAVEAALRSVEGGGPPALDLDLPAGVGGGPLELPPSALADAVRAAVGDDALRPLVTIRQYRTPRAAFDGDRLVAALSFDVVVYEVEGARFVSNEVEVEVEPSEADALPALAAALDAHDLRRSDRSQAARGLLLVRRTLAQSALVLPDERRRLEAAASDPDPDLRWRAQVVLLDARGFRPDTIATQTGLSMARVRHWRERFREARLGVLDRDSTPVEPQAPPPAESPSPPADPSPSTARPSVPDLASGRPEGDGVSGGDPVAPALASDMDALLDLFSPSSPDTPFFDGYSDDDGDPAGAERAHEASPSTGIYRDPYPVVLGPLAPVAEVAADDHPAFVDVDLSRLGQPPSTSVSRLGPPPSAAPARPTTSRPALDGDTPLLEAAHALTAHVVAAVGESTDRFLATRAPSDARRLLVAIHGFRLTAETFEQALPAESAHGLVAALRPLAADLDAGLDLARTALAGDGPADLVRRASTTLARAADRAVEAPAPWKARALRLVARLASQVADGARRSDDAPLADDFVGAPGSAPSPTRLRHVLGSEVWRRFEAVLAVEEDLDRPTIDAASHLAVALSGLRFVISLAETTEREAVDDLVAGLAEAEGAVVAARSRHAAGDGQALDGLPEVWDEATSPLVKRRLAAFVSTI